MTTNCAFEVTSKRKKGYPSETKVKRGYRIVHGEKELFEKLGRNDLCPCGSGRLFQKMLSHIRLLLTAVSEIITSGKSVNCINVFRSTFLVFESFILLIR